VSLLFWQIYFRVGEIWSVYAPTGLWFYHKHSIICSKVQSAEEANSRDFCSLCAPVPFSMLPGWGFPKVDNYSPLFSILIEQSKTELVIPGVIVTATWSYC
jgi:hypothetical protein